MKPLQLLAVLLAIGCAQAPAQNNQSAPQPAAGANAEQEAIMDRIEREVRLPEGAGQLATYARYYAWQQREDGVRKVIAFYLHLSGHEPGRYWVAENALPLILDGGCGMITLSYDVAAQRIEHVSCNGVA
jgi:hypothetical protein